MKSISTRIVSFFVSILLIASSMSVGFTAFSAELASLTNIGSETIEKNGANIGTATHYEYQRKNASQNWADLLSLASNGSAELNHKTVSSANNIHQGNGVYTTTANESYKRIEQNGVGPDNSYSCQNGSNFAAEFSNLYSCSNRTTHAEGCDGSCTKANTIVTKQYGWDAEGYYYYDYYNEDGNGLEHTFGVDINKSAIKLRDESVKHPHSYETYTYSFPKGTLLKDVVLANTNGNDLRSSYYEIYATTGKIANLYNAENRVAIYDGTEYGYAFASHFTFNEPIEATYVGLKVIDPVAITQIGRAGNYYNAARIWMLKFFGTEGYEKCSIVTGALHQVGQTTASEDNYSIPAKLFAEDPNNLPQHIYYRNGTPHGAGASSVGSRLWDRATNQDTQFDGRESYKSGNDLLYYDGTHTELFYDFGAIYDINEIIYANHNNDKLRASDMTFYASNNFEDLFTPANELAYEETNVAAISLKTKDLKARFVGISFQDTCWDNASYPGNDYLRACEFDVMGKYSGESQVATVQNFADYTSALAAVDGKTSVVVGAPQVYRMINGEKKTTDQSAQTFERLYNGNLSESDTPTYDLQHIDADGNYVSGPNVYTAFKYDLKLSRKITDIFLGNHDNSYYQASAYKVYVSEDETIDESDLVAQVVEAGRSEHFNIHANLISLPEGTTGRYVEVRIFMPTKMIGDGQDATAVYTRLKELNIFGDMGYSLKGESGASKQAYFTKNAENIANSLIAMTPIYKAENINGLNFGTRPANTSKYKGTFGGYGSEDWDEFSVAFTETAYYDTDGDITGVSYTREVFTCGGINGHAAGCPKDETCTKKVEAIDDGSVYQTVIYKLKVRSTITEVDIFHSTNYDRLTSHYLLSFADKEEDLFTDAATTIDVANYIGYRYNLVKLNRPVTARFVAFKLICGVQPGVITSNASNYGRFNHMAVVGKEAPCEVHTTVSIPGYEPTCTTEGLSEGLECTECGTILALQEKIEPLGHSGVGILGYAPTCTETGLSDGIVCERCEEIILPQETIEPTGHNPIVIMGKEPTCTETGLTAGSVCSNCGEMFTTQNVINALGHDIEIVGEKAPTESEDGYTGDEVCKRCDRTIKKGSVIPKILKDFIKSVTLDGEINCLNNRINVLFRLPVGKSDVQGMQLKFTLPQGFTLSEVSTPLADAGWTVTSKLSTGFVILRCGNDMATLESVAMPDASDKYHVLTLTLTPDGTAVAGQQSATVLVEDVTTNYDSNPNSTSANVSFNYVAGHGVAVLPEVAPTCTSSGLTQGEHCPVCGEVFVTQQIIPASGHNWKIDAEREVEYCANNCGVEEIPVYVVRFYGRSERLLYETAVKIGEDNMGYLTDADIASANAAAPYLYGYDHAGWDIELSTKTPIEASRIIYAVYQRETELYNTVVKDVNGTTIETKEIEFDQRFVVESETAKSFLVNGQVVGGKGSVTLYGCGSDLAITLSEAEAPEKISVALLKTDAEYLNGKYVYRVFLHVYNPLEEDISEIGVMFAPGSAYTTDANFTMETLDTGKYITLPTELETNDVLATFTGIKAGVTRVVRAYAKSGNTTTYSNLVVKHTFN